MLSYYKMVDLSKKESLKAFTEKFKQFTIDQSSASPSASLSSFINKDLELLFTTSNIAVQQSYEIVTKLEKEVIEPLEIFYSSILTIYEESNELFTSIITKITEAKDRLDSQKARYYRSASQAYNPSSEIESSPIEDNLIRIKSLAQTNEQSYKYELARFNIIAEECNEQYMGMITNLKQHEESRVNYIRLSLEKYKKIIQEYNAIISELIEKISFLLSKDICNTEISSILSALTSNITKPNDKESRIAKEAFVSYSEFAKENEIRAQIEKCKVIQFEPKLSKEEQSRIIEESVLGLISENDIDVILVAKLIEVLQANHETPKRFLDAFLMKKTNIWLCFKNYSNLVHLSNIIACISLCHDSINSDKFEINFTVLFITERVFYKDANSKQKVYLSALLSHNPFYQMHSFWKDIIELKLAKKLDDLVSQLNKMKLPEDEPINIFSKLGNKIGNKLGLNSNSKNKTSYIVDNSRIKKFIPSFDQLDLDKKAAFDMIATRELSTIIREAIPMLANFNFPITKTVDLINELAKEYRIANSQIDQYINSYNVYSFTIKKRLLNDQRTMGNITEEKYRTYLRMALPERTAKLITLSLEYLCTNDYMSILLLNKSINKKVSAKVFKIVLKKPHLDIKTRLKIWSSILKTAALKREYDYKKLSTDLSNVSDTTQNDIKMDVPRTFISPDLNATETKLQLSNVLIAISQVNEDIKYCQGMNYFAQFLLEIASDEEEAFFIFFGFFKSTEYPLIFSKELDKMKMFFHLFKRLLSLYEPEIANYFNTVNFEVSFFLVPWFITLFQSVRPSITDKGLPVVLVRVIDEFLTVGWKGLMKIGINILKYYEQELLGMKYEDLLQFLMNTGLTLDFFSNDNCELFDKMIKEIKISKKLVYCIKEEFTSASIKNDNNP